MTAGAVLCGGRSRRMGTDKALVEVAGVAMAARVAAALDAGGCTPVVLVGGDRDELARLGRPVVPDRFPGEGPAGGVLTAIGAVGESSSIVVVASCDLPLLDAATVVLLRDALDDTAVSAAVAVTDRWQLSLTAWRVDAADDLATAWRHGVRSLRALVSAVSHAEVAVPAAAIRNINTPDDLSAAADASR